MEVELDKLIYMIDNVSADEFQKFVNRLDLLDLNCKIPKVTQKIGTGISEYHYSLNIGQGEGAIFVGWQHNASKPTVIGNDRCWAIKVEYNPNKTVEAFYEVIRGLQWAFDDRPKRITTMDLCFDLPVYRDQIFVMPRNGREENRYNGNRYYGYKSNHGHLKVYDKKRERKERAGIDIFADDEEGFLRELTRIEYTWKVKEGIPLNVLNDIEDVTMIGSEYIIRNISGLGLNGIKPEIRACVITVMMGQMQIKDFSRTMKKHIENALAQCEELSLGSLIQGSWEKILNTVNKHILSFEV